MNRDELLCIMESIEGPIYISDPETYELLYVNEAFRKQWGDGIGKKCFSVLQNRDGPCPFCTNDRILSEDAGQPYIWEFQNEVNHRWYRCTDKAIRLSDGRWVRSEFAQDITDYKVTEQEQSKLLERTRIQQQVIIDLARHGALTGSDFMSASQVITEKVAEAFEIERVSVWLLAAGNEELRCVDLYERSSGEHIEGTVLRANEYPRYFAALDQELILDAQYARTDYRTSEFTEQYLEPLGITSMLDAAVRVYGKLIGIICWEHVGAPRKWQPDMAMFAGVIADQVAISYMSRERHRAEKALKESGHRLQTILDCVQAGIMLIDATEHVIVEANPASLRMLNAVREETVGRKCHRFLCTHKEGLCPITDLGNEISNSEQMILDVEGREIPVLMTVIPLALNNRQYLLASFVDLSDRKRAEEELKHRMQELSLAKYHLEVMVSDTTGREKRMIELKQEVNDLLKELDREPKYMAPQRTEALRKA
ncbi:MAG: PAS domain-containing protein [Planctomycetota bacterium]